MKKIKRVKKQSNQDLDLKMLTKVSGGDWCVSDPYSYPDPTSTGCQNW